MSLSTKVNWESYHNNDLKTSIVDDDVLLAMIQDVVDTVHLLEKMYGMRGAIVITRGLIAEWLGLRSFADARGITNYARL